MKKVKIYRYKVTNNYSLGHCFVKHESGIADYVGASLERGWRNNEKTDCSLIQATHFLTLIKRTREL